MTTQNELNIGIDRLPSRFVVGIDLGTTNSAVAYVDTQKDSHRVLPFLMEQLVDLSTSDRRETLPSFHYQLTGQEAASIPTKMLSRLGHGQAIVGVLARDRGLQMPGRQIASAKSWLCHSGIDRTAAVLPWHGDEDVETLSPVQASGRYLEHMRRVWDQHHPNHLLADQDVVLTLPASFDEVARELTIEAARIAGLPRVFLLEEPQAAFYAWLSRHAHDWQDKIHAGQTILVCDIGGGTTDFTLIRVRSSSSKEQPCVPESSLHRVAVGQHLILGGDNLDLALARAAEHRMLGEGCGKLSPRQWDALRMNCRVAKEILLGDHPPEEYTIMLPGSGARLLSNSMSVTIDLRLVREVLLDGFFAQVDLEEKPQQLGIGFQEFGLPYAADPVITRHLADFLWQHRFAGREESPIRLPDRTAAKPDWVLFNGGVLEAKQIQTAIVDQLHAWFADCDDRTPTDWQVGVLEGNRLDLAVAMGAAYFGMVRRGQGIRIDARLARSYYLTVSDDPPRAICLVPGQASAGDRYRLDDRPFELAIGQPVQFPLWISSLNLVDAPGTIVDIDLERMKAMPPIRTVLELPKRRKQEMLQVLVEAELTEIGTLNLACVSQDQAQRWKLAFDVRSAVETDRSAHTGVSEQAGIVEQSRLDQIARVLEDTFGPSGAGDPKILLKRLVEESGEPRSSWMPSLLRGMWQSLIDLDDGRKKSAAHEARWINLLGYCLRPGYGFAADDWRVATTWRKVQGKLAFQSISSISEAVILWRRIAGGFAAGQQRALYQEIMPRVRSILTSESKSNLAAVSTNEAIELLRLVGSLELLPSHDKFQLGTWCISAVARKKLVPIRSAILWSLGRIGSRVPVYGPLNQMISVDRVQIWIADLLKLGDRSTEIALALMQLARKTGDRYRDVSESTRQTVLHWMTASQAPEQYVHLVAEIAQLDTDQQAAVLGDSLPLGLRIR